MKLKFILAACLTGACFATSGFADEKAEKKEDALSQCYAEIGDKPRTELEACLGKMKKQARHALGQQLDKTRKDIIDTGSSAGDDALKSLEHSQKAFETFLKAECQRVIDAAMGGSGAGDFGQGCEVDLLHWRTKQLAAE